MKEAEAAAAAGSRVRPREEEPNTMPTMRDEKRPLQQRGLASSVSSTGTLRTRNRIASLRSHHHRSHTLQDNLFDSQVSEGSPSGVAEASPGGNSSGMGYADQDAMYFHSYNNVGIHEEMIKDHIRTEAYRDAIFAHVEYIRDKVVIDVGCGTGILSIFCAYAGARKVYAIDASGIAVQAREVVKANGLSDIITVIVGRVEEVQLEEEADVIVSEWMGYMLLYESMLGSVIYARDRWLKPGGLMLPSFATLYVAPITNPDRYRDSIDFWREVYGIDMSAMLPLAKQCAFEEPCVEGITAENVLSWPVVVKRIDCRTVTVKELEVVTASFNVSSMMTASLHGFALWFDVSFGYNSGALENNSESSIESTISADLHSNGPSHNGKQGPVANQIVLSTAPEEPPTHWAQTILYIYDPIDVVQDQVISGLVALSQSRENPRFLNVHLEYTCGDRYFVKESVMR